MKKNSAAIKVAFIILLAAFLSAMAIWLSFCLPSAFFAALDAYIHAPHPGILKSAQALNADRSVEAFESGLTETVPWENDELFLEMKKQYKTGLMMSAYRTVLIDPLPGEEANVHLAAKYLAGTVLKPGEVFSQNSCLGPYAKEKGYRLGPSLFGDIISDTYGGGVCKIASTLYNVAVLCDLPVIERHCHSRPVPYVPYGQDATVSYGMFDFKFKNDTAFPILIWAEGVDNTLYIAFYGSEKPPEVVWHHKVLRVFKAGNAYRHNPDLKAGEERLLEEGMDGAIIESRVTVRFKDGKAMTKQMGRSYYDPLPYLYEKKLF